MNYLEAFRNPEAAANLAQQIKALAGRMESERGAVSIMEVCGTHTMAIARNGIRNLLPDNVELVSGPGCPVCVTPAGYIDAAVELARANVMMATFGDMLSVPGSSSNLSETRAEGAAVITCYSPSSALDMARENPRREVVFLAIGFETTIAPLTAILHAAAMERLDNFSMLTAFKLIPPAMEALLQDPGISIDGFLCPAHVSAVIGADAYLPIVEKHRKPCVIAGFEPLDILLGVKGVLEQITSHSAAVDNQYSRVVTRAGNPIAQELMRKHLQPADVSWRGIGVIPASGLAIRLQYAAFDAWRKFGIQAGEGAEPAGCLCGEVLKGKLRPPECGLFGKSCTPDHPVGSCMISAEGACAAYFKYIVARPEKAPKRG